MICSPTVSVQFAQGNGPGSRALGPYNAFHLLDGVAYAEGRVFAFFDKQQQDWYSHPWATTGPP